ncbi:hypothetical protein [Spelaeicoccus albus]|nr:hypothetical protein [Spelaeicoccus albus]
MPDRMRGTTLWPLASLADIDSDVHASHLRKYQDRPALPERPVEPLDCTWAECVFLCPVDPQQLVSAARTVHPNLPARDWFVIDADLLEAERTVLFKPDRWDPATGPPPVTTKECELFTPRTLAAASTATNATLTRLTDASNRMPLFVDVIDVLHRGPIDVTAAQTLTA